MREGPRNVHTCSGQSVGHTFLRVGSEVLSKSADICAGGASGKRNRAAEGSPLFIIAYLSHLRPCDAMQERQVGGENGDRRRVWCSGSGRCSVTGASGHPQLCKPLRRELQMGGAGASPKLEAPHVPRRALEEGPLRICKWPHADMTSSATRLQGSLLDEARA